MQIKGAISQNKRRNKANQRFLNLPYNAFSRDITSFNSRFNPFLLRYNAFIRITSTFSFLIHERNMSIICLKCFNNVTCQAKTILLTSLENDVRKLQTFSK